MKKLVLLGFAAAAMLAGCNRNEVLEQNAENAIAFNQSFVENMTKSNDYNGENLPASMLYGAMVTPENKAFYPFDQKKIEANGSYTPVQYWLPGATYTFTAFAPYETAAQLTYTKPAAADANDDNRGTLAFDNSTFDGEVDLMKAVCPQFTFDAAKSAKTVNLNFEHQLCRLRFKFDNALGTDAYKLRISGLKVANAVKATAFDVAQGNDVNEAETFTLNFATTETVEGQEVEYLIGNNMSLETDHKYLIANEGDLKVEFKIEMIQYDINNVAHVAKTFNYTGDNAVVLSAFNMEKGHSYRLAVELNAGNIDPDGQMEPIEFTVTTDEWGAWNETIIK